MVPNLWALYYVYKLVVRVKLLWAERHYTIKKMYVYKNYIVV